MQILSAYVSKHRSVLRFLVLLEEEEFRFFSAWKRRSVADPPGYASNLEGGAFLYDGQIVFIWKHPSVKNCAKRSIAELTPVIKDRKNIRIPAVPAGW